jgi:hypothetical protein
MAPRVERPRAIGRGTMRILPRRGRTANACSSGSTDASPATHLHRAIAPMAAALHVSCAKRESPAAQQFSCLTKTSRKIRALAS